MNPDPPTVPKRLVEVKIPSQKALYFEESNGYDPSGRRKYLEPDKTYCGDPNNKLGIYDEFFGRHDNRVNTLFFDGHVQCIPSRTTTRHFYSSAGLGRNNVKSMYYTYGDQTEGF